MQHLTGIIGSLFELALARSSHCWAQRPDYGFRTHQPSGRLIPRRAGQKRATGRSVGGSALPLPTDAGWARDPDKAERPLLARGGCATAFLEVESGGVLLSHTVSSAVPSALRGLASGFGMGPGVSLSQ
jgi:hypothetical protein